ncbi:DUF4157 domain-containing protein [Streptomyces sp. NPDC051133]|uniref:eCIS core domain-containing protein n=1 Tax=Streptomyces sp. NPDC051133 TaxID=3155521 RepID=UPI00341A286C
MQTSRPRTARTEEREPAPGARTARRQQPGAGAALPPPLTAGALRAVQRGAGNAAAAGMIARRARTAPDPEAAATGVREVLRSAGTPLAAPVRQEMEARLGADFSDVRLHTGAAAARSARDVGARAYTSGSHVVIGDGGGDKHTLAHELTHVIQQRGGAVAGTDTGHGLRVSDPGDAFERAAEANATRVMSGPVPVPQSTGEQGGASADPARAGQIQRVLYNTATAPTATFLHPVVDNQGRTTSIEMMTDGSFTGTPPAADPGGYAYIRQLGLTNFWIRFHLVNEQAGGPGQQNNLVPASKRDNSRYEAAIEKPLKDRVDAVATANALLPANSARHHVYFGVDVDYATADPNTTPYQQSYAPHFVNSLTVHLKQYDPTTATWTPHFAQTRFDFVDPQPADLGTAVAAATLTLAELQQLTGYRGWNNDDVGFLQSIGAGGARSAEFQNLVDTYGSTGPEESVVHTFWQMPFRAPQPGRRGGQQTGAVSFAERTDNSTRLNNLARLIATGKIRT